MNEKNQASPKTNKPNFQQRQEVSAASSIVNIKPENKTSKGKKLGVVGAVGALLLAGGGLLALKGGDSENNAPNSSQPVAEAGQNNTEISPRILNADTNKLESGYISGGIKEAESILNEASPNLTGHGETQGLSFDPLIKAANGDAKELNEIGVDQDEIVNAYNLNKLLIEKTKPLQSGIKEEENTQAFVDNWPEGTGPLSEIQVTNALMYLNGKVIENIKSGRISLETSNNNCPTSAEDSQVVLDDGYIVTKIAPGLTLPSLYWSKKAAKCDSFEGITGNPATLTSILKLAIIQSKENNLPTMATYYEIRQNILTLEDPKADALIVK